MRLPEESGCPLATAGCVGRGSGAATAASPKEGQSSGMGLRQEDYSGPKPPLGYCVKSISEQGFYPMAPGGVSLSGERKPL